MTLVFVNSILFSFSLSCSSFPQCSVIMPLVLFDQSPYLSLMLRTGMAQMELCSSMGPAGVDNERAEEHSDYNRSSDDGNGIRSVPAECHPP